MISLLPQESSCRDISGNSVEAQRWSVLHFVSPKPNSRDLLWRCSQFNHHVSSSYSPSSNEITLETNRFETRLCLRSRGRPSVCNEDVHTPRRHCWSYAPRLPILRTQINTQVRYLENLRLIDENVLSSPEKKLRQKTKVC